MARLEYVNLHHSAIVLDHLVDWERDHGAISISGLPQIFWNSGAPWDEANHWALDKVNDNVKIDAVKRLMCQMHRYANWLEKEEVEWRISTTRKSDQALVKFRDFLIAELYAGNIRTLTAKARMTAVIQFYQYYGMIFPVCAPSMITKAGFNARPDLDMGLWKLI